MSVLMRWPGLATDLNGSRPMMIPGERYRIRHKTPTQRRHRESLMTFLELRPVSNGFVSVWSARPVAGTQEIAAVWISRIELIVSIADATVYINKVLPNG